MSNKPFTQMLNNVTCGDCIDVLAHLTGRSVQKATAVYYGLCCSAALSIANTLATK